MRSRVIRPEFWSDHELARLPHGARLTYIGLWTMADREGRLIDSAVHIAGLLFPHSGREAVDEVDAWLHELHAGGWLVRYERDGGKWIWIRNFRKHQPIHPNEPPSRIPPPPEQEPARAVAQPEQQSEHGFELQEIAQRIWERHPRHRRGGLHQVEQAICNVVNGAVHGAAIARRIDEAHEAWCACEEWQRAGGRYVPRLDRWISERRWETMPQSEDEI